MIRDLDQGSRNYLQKRALILELLTSFCMKDNPGPGGALRGGKNGRKAWEIDEDAT